MTPASPTPAADPRAWRACVAANRFGLGEADLATVGNDPAAWLHHQIGPADAALSPGPAEPASLPDLAQALAVLATARQQRDPDSQRALRRLLQEDQQSRLYTALRSQRPFAERLVLFWTNHFTVSLAKGSVHGLVGCFEREAIRPHIAGRFVDLLQAAVTHPAMLRYLDNQGSAGPHSEVVQRARRRGERTGQAPRLTGLNENLAREVLELHTLGVARPGSTDPAAKPAADATLGPARPGRPDPALHDAPYSQADVTGFAAVLTGWRGPQGMAPAPGQPAATARDLHFDAAWHEPGEKSVLGRRYAQGPEALRAVLADLARHPATARHLATKLARHVVADQPPPALVDRLAARYLDSEGDLAAVYRALIDSPEAWQAPGTKLKTPEEFWLSAGRQLALDARAARRLAEIGPGVLSGLGQRPQSAPSPAGWPDRADEWLGPEALWQRLEWARRLAARAAAGTDARRLAERSLGPAMGQSTRQQIDHAADGRQALALLWLSPEFQRR